MTAGLFDSLILCKPYFDREGFIVAEENSHIVGFAHAGFAPNADGSAIAHDVGVICMVQVAPHQDHDAIANDLLQRCQEYLTVKGAVKFFGGSNPLVDPFYLGLYGGSQVSGVVASDEALCRLFESANYVVANEHLVLRRQLSGFRPVVDRSQMQIRRAHHVECSLDPPSRTWWHACTWGHTERYGFSLKTRQGGEQLASLVLWDCEPIASSWGVHAAGVAELQLSEMENRESIGIFLVGEALRQALTRGITMAEVHIEANSSNLELYSRLGFAEVDRTRTYRRLMDG